MKPETRTINMDDMNAKRGFMSFIGTLRGLVDFTWKPRRRTRSLNANAYYHVAVVDPFLDYLRDQYGDSRITHEQAHEVLKIHVLGMDVKTDREGNTIQFIPETKIMDVPEFSAYIEDAAAFLATFAKIVVIPSEEFWESKDQLRRGKAA